MPLLSSAQVPLSPLTLPCGVSGRFPRLEYTPELQLQHVPYVLCYKLMAKKYFTFAARL